MNNKIESINNYVYYWKLLSFNVMLHVDDKSLCFIACESGKHGEDCLKDCGNCKSGDVCDRVTGHCQDGCQAGWWMETCKVGK